MRATRGWEVRRDLDASSDTDAHASFDPAAGHVRFGDGVRGRVPLAIDFLAQHAQTIRGALLDVLRAERYRHGHYANQRDAPHAGSLPQPLPAGPTSAGQCLLQ